MGNKEQVLTTGRLSEKELISIIFAWNLAFKYDSILIFKNLINTFLIFTWMSLVKISFILSNLKIIFVLKNKTIVF